MQYIVGINCSWIKIKPWLINSSSGSCVATHVKWVKTVPLTVSFNVEKYLSKSILVLITKDYSIFIFISQMKAYFRDLFRMSTSLVTVTCITHPKHTHKKPNQTKKHTQIKPWMASKIWQLTKIHFYPAAKITIFMSKPMGKKKITISLVKFQILLENINNFTLFFSHMLRG